MSTQTLRSLALATLALAPFLLAAQAGPVPVPATVAALPGGETAGSGGRRSGRPVRLEVAVRAPGAEVAMAPTQTRRGTRLRPVADAAAPQPALAAVHAPVLTARGTRLRPVAPAEVTDTRETVAALTLR